jgi:two-component system sensor histidine kinase UhpB
MFTLLVFAASARWEWHEVFSRWVLSFETWQADELPLALLALTIGLIWFAARRSAEARGEIAERWRAEQRIGELLAANRELAQQLIRVQEDERRALARELHDELGQTCNAIRVEAACVIKAKPEDHAAIVASAQRIAAAAEGLYDLVRDMLRRLRPAALDSLGLIAALQELCETWEEQSGIACRFVPSQIDADPDEAIGMTLYRLVQESLTNVLRHAQASVVNISLHGEADPAGSKRIALRIEDDGRGMSDPDGPQTGLGMLGMRERVAALHGRIRFDSAPGRGLRIDVELPIEAVAP